MSVHLLDHPRDNPEGRGGVPLYHNSLTLCQGRTAVFQRASQQRDSIVRLDVISAGLTKILLEEIDRYWSLNSEGGNYVEKGPETWMRRAGPYSKR